MTEGAALFGRTELHLFYLHISSFLTYAQTTLIHALRGISRAHMSEEMPSWGAIVCQ